MTIAKLQADLRAGKITKAQYDAKLKQLLDAGDIEQAAYDEALDFDGDDEDDDKPIYTQADMDRSIVVKARSLVRKALKDAGVDLADVKNNDLLPKVVEMVQAGKNAGKSDSELQTELGKLRGQVAGIEGINGRLKAAIIENAVLKAAGKYAPHNPAQVVRALNSDYAGLLEFDDESGELVQSSVQKALKRVAAAEPNLFNNPEGKTDEDEGGGNPKPGFSGKAPAGGGQGSGTPEKQAKMKADALEMMGFGPKKQ